MLGLWRRRCCLDCQKIFTTKESVIADNLFVLKRKGPKQRFIYEKLFASIFKVINARKNMDSGDDAKLTKKIAGKIIEKIFALSKNKLISSKNIIDITYKELKKISPTYAEGYIFYSEYRLKTMLQSGIIRLSENYR